MKKILMALCLMFSSFGYGFINYGYESNRFYEYVGFSVGNYSKENFGYFSFLAGVEIRGNVRDVPMMELVCLPLHGGVFITLQGYGIFTKTHLSSTVIAASIATLTAYGLYKLYQAKNSKTNEVDDAQPSTQKTT